MRVVQALHWMNDVSGDNDPAVMNRLLTVLNAPDQGAAIRADLRAGIHTLPAWMQPIVRQLLGAASDDAVSPSRSTFPSPATA